MNKTQFETLSALPGHAAVAEQCRTISEWLADNALQYSGGSAVEGIERTPLSHADLSQHVQDVGEQLCRHGIGRGDVVLISLANGPEALTAILAVASVAVAFPIAPEEPTESIERLLKQVSVKAVLFDASRPFTAQSVAEKKGWIQLPIAIDPSGTAGVFTLDRTPPTDCVQAEVSRIDDAAILVKTAGTTSEPKIIAWSQASLYLSANTAAKWMDVNASDRSLCMMPFSHLHSVVRSTMPGLLYGGAVICCPGFDRIRVMDWIRTFQPTYMTAVPGIYRSILARVEETAWQTRSTSLRFLATGSDRIDQATVQQLTDTFGVPVREFYGMSEVSPMLAATPAGKLAHEDGAVGPPLESWTLTCLGDDGETLPVNSEGEIAVKGGLINPVVLRGGIRDKFSHNKWFHTGDRGWLDTEGFLHVTGRMDERITRGGKKIAPETVEEVLAKHPQVAEAIVFPIPDTLLGERVAAVVVSVSGMKPTEKALRVFTAERLPDYMVPDRVFMTDVFPQNAAGKIARKEMAKHLDHEINQTEMEGVGDFIPKSFTEATLAELVKELLEINTLDLDTDFMTLGGDSFLATCLLVGIEEKFGILLSPAQFLASSSVRGLSRLLDELPGISNPPLIFTVQEGNGKAPLFLAHGPDGYAYYAHTFAKHMDRSQTVYVFQWQEPTRKINDGLTLEMYASAYVEAMRVVQPTGPYYLGGHSFGAQMAFVVAQQLIDDGQEVGLLALIDDEADLFKRRFGIHENLPTSSKVYDICRHLLHAYVPGIYAGDITLFVAEVLPAETLADPYLGWQDLTTGEVERIVVPGDHTSMMSESHIAQWSHLLEQRLYDACQALESIPASNSRLVAIRELAQAYGQHPDIRASTLARQAAKCGDLTSEIAHYNKAIAISRKQPYWVFRNLAAALIQEGDTAAAVTAYQQAIEREQTPIIGNDLLAGLYRNLGHTDKARECVEEAERHANDDACTQCALGGILLGNGDYRGAEKYLRRAIDLQPMHARAHRWLSGATEQQGRLDEAIEVALKMIELCPDNPDYLCHLGMLYGKMGDLVSSENSYQMAIESDSSYPEAYQKLSSLLERRGLIEEAIGAATKAAELRQDNPWVWHHLGNLHVKQANLAAAQAARGRAISLNPRHLITQRVFYAISDRIGVVLARLGRFDRGEAFD